MRLSEFPIQIYQGSLTMLTVIGQDNAKPIMGIRSG